MYFYDTPEFYEMLPKFSFFFLISGLIVTLGWGFQYILRALVSKIKGDLTKMNNNTPKDENIQKVDEFLGNNKTEKKENKPRSIATLAGFMLITVFMLAGMISVAVLNEMFDAVKEIHIFAVLILSFVMITCAILIFFAIYLENEIHLEEKNNTRLRNIIDSANDQRYTDLLAEIRRLNQQNEYNARFLKKQYGDLYQE